MATNGNINRLFVPYEIALMLKEKGFNEPCLSKYSTTSKLDIASTFGITNSMIIEGIDYQKYGWICTAPLYQQVIDFVNSKGFSLKYGNIELSLLDKQIEECLNKLESIK